MGLNPGAARGWADPGDKEFVYPEEPSAQGTRLSPSEDRLGDALPPLGRLAGLGCRCGGGLALGS